MGIFALHTLFCRCLHVFLRFLQPVKSALAERMQNRNLPPGTGFAMSLCGGIAIGIVFWGAAEPIYHFSSPPGSLPLEPFSAPSAKWSMTITFLHWTFSPYSLYVVCAIPIGLAFYNHGQPFTVSSGLYFLMGEKCHGWFWKTGGLSLSLLHCMRCYCLFRLGIGPGQQRTQFSFRP